MTGYIGINQPSVQNITNLISNGSLSSNTSSWTMASTYYTTTQYSGYISSVVTTTSSTPRYHTQSFTSISGSTAATKQILYCQAMVCGKPSNVSTPTVRVRQYKNGSSTATYTNLSSSTSSSINCNFSSINMSSLPSGGYAYAKINNGNTQYTNGTVTISKGDTITIYLDRTSNNGNAGVYLYRDKGAAIVDSNSMAGNVGETSDMPDYHEWGNSLTYTWNSNNAPYDFMTVNITFENESSGYLNCFIKLVQAWNKNSTYLETYDGTDYYSYDRVEFAMASTSTANDTIFIKNIFIVNLTAKFGAGNEPTKAWCDENLQFNASNNTIYYFSSELVPIAQQIKGLYVGIGNIAKQAKKAYIGINNVAKLWYLSQREWVWDVYQYGYNPVEGTSFSQSVSSAFYVGTSYTLNQSTGQFSVDQTTQIARSSTGASNAVGKYLINLASSSGTQTGDKVYLITAASYSFFTGMSLTITPYTSQIYRGTLVNSVIDLDVTTYPMNGVQGNYWYVLRDIETISYSGDYIDQCVYMENKAYRLLTITSSGTLALDNSLKADVWICGGGAGGKYMNYNHDTSCCGGGGAYATEINNTNIKDLNIIIGAGGSASDARSGTENVQSYGGTSSITGDLSITTFGGDRNSSGIGKYAFGGTGAGGGKTYETDDGHKAAARVGLGDGQSKLPFNSSYFPYSFCDGGGGGGYGRYIKGGAGGSNGSNGGATTSINSGSSSGPGGGHYGGKGGRGYYETTDPADDATGYGSGGGGAAFTESSDDRKSGEAGNGYQGVCFIRIPLE